MSETPGKAEHEDEQSPQPEDHPQEGELELTQEEAPLAEVRPAKTRTALTLAVLALLVSLGALAGAYYFWRESTAFSQQLADSAHARDSSIEKLTAELREARHSREALEQAQSELREQEQVLREQLERLSTHPIDQTDLLTLAEAEYLIRLANERLQLDGDVETAITALRIADSRLRSLDDPALLTVRAQLADDIAALKAAGTVDVSGTALALSSLEHQVDELPLIETEIPARSETASAEPEMRGWRQLASGLWREMKTLVVIRHEGEKAHPLIPPDERRLIRENLRMELTIARLALLRHDAGNYHGSLKASREWTSTYFDTDQSAVASFLNTLEELDQVDVAPAPPDISRALALLRQFRSRTGRGTDASGQNP